MQAAEGAVERKLRALARPSKAAPAPRCVGTIGARRPLTRSTRSNTLKLKRAKKLETRCDRRRRRRSADIDARRRSEPAATPQQLAAYVAVRQQVANELLTTERAYVDHLTRVWCARDAIACALSVMTWHCSVGVLDPLRDALERNEPILVQTGARTGQSDV